MKNRLLPLLLCTLCLVAAQLAVDAQHLLMTPDGHVLGGPGGAFVLAAPDEAPVASAVTVSGTPTVEQTLTVASFTYTDAENDPAGTPQYKWYRADDALGTNSTVISGATAATYTLVTADAYKYITVGVTPVASRGTITGSEAKAPYAPVAPSPAFITHWNVPAGSFTFPLGNSASYNYSCTIDWGDNSPALPLPLMTNTLPIIMPPQALTPFA